jgi:arylsulfatase A-like enzyme
MTPTSRRSVCGLLAFAFVWSSFGYAPIVRASSGSVSHVLVVSLDGFHDFDLTDYIHNHPSSALAALVQRGRRYTNATSTGPSDSFPATLAMFTGGSPVSTGVYYDVSWDDNLSPAGSNCSVRGTTVSYNEAINVSTSVRFTTINPAKLPRNPDANCTPVYPHQYVHVNTIFEVIKAAGFRTAASDKHPSYEILNGPSGAGVDDLYTPEINPDKKDIAKTIQNDELKVLATLNQIAGYASTDDAHATPVGVPTIMSMNFQAPNIGQKFSGYVVDDSGPSPATVTTLGPLAGTVPGLAQAFDYVDGALQRMLDALDAQGLTDSTLIIVTAKHGNSPVDPAQLRLINPATTLIPLINSVQAGLAAQVTDDTNALIWLKDHSRAAEVAAVLQANADAIGAESFYVGNQIDSLMGGELAGNPSRRPDIIIEPVQGVVYAAPASKLADHGGFHEQDLHVPLVVVYPHRAAGTISAPVSLQQIAPTILHALQLKKNALDAVRMEHTPQLPGLDDDEDE